MNGISEQSSVTVTAATESQAEDTDKLEGLQEPAGQLFQVTVDTVIELEAHHANGYKCLNTEGIKALSANLTVK